MWGRVVVVHGLRLVFRRGDGKERVVFVLLFPLRATALRDEPDALRATKGLGLLTSLLVAMESGSKRLIAGVVAVESDKRAKRTTASVFALRATPDKSRTRPVAAKLLRAKQKTNQTHDKPHHLTYTLHMELDGRGLLLQVDPFKENDALITVFTEEHGLLRGLAKWAYSRRTRGTYCVGNWVEFRWSARLEEHLGNIICELEVPTGYMIMRDRQRCYALQSMAALILSAFQERDAHPRLYFAMDRLMEALHFDLEPWLADYARFEAALLREAGFGLGLDACVVTGGTENLRYLSPKSGCAVSADEGAPYHDKLFAYPALLLDEMHVKAESDAIANALDVTGHFLYHWLFSSLNRKLPSARERLISSFVVREEKKEMV